MKPKITLGIFLIIIGIMLLAIAMYYDCTNELAENNRIREQEEYADNTSILITTVSQPENNHYVDSVPNKDILICYRRPFKGEHADGYFLNETDIVYTAIWYNGYLYTPTWSFYDIDEDYIVETTIIEQANSEMRAYYYEEDKLLENSNEPLFIEWDYIIFEKATKEELENL